MLDELGEGKSDVNEGLETLLRVGLVLLRVLRILLVVQTDRRALRTSSGETNDESRSVDERNVETLVLRNGVVDRVGVGEVAGLGDGELAELRVDEPVGGEGRLELLDDLGSGFRLDLLVVVAVYEIVSVS